MTGSSSNATNRQQRRESSVLKLGAPRLKAAKLQFSAARHNENINFKGYLQRTNSILTNKKPAPARKSLRLYTLQIGYARELKATPNDARRGHRADQSRNGTPKNHKYKRWHQPADPNRTAVHSRAAGTQRNSTSSHDCTGQANKFNRQCRHAMRREQTSWIHAR